MDGADSSEPDRTTMMRELEHGLAQERVGGCAFLRIFTEVQYHLLQ